MVAQNNETTGQLNREELLQFAINTVRNGNKDGARMMFLRVWEEDKRNERAMLWLAKLAKDNSERKQWLNRVLKVNPDNQTAKSALQQMSHSRAASENRMLVLFGVIAGTLFIVAVLVLLIALAS